MFAIEQKLRMETEDLDIIQQKMNNAKEKSDTIKVEELPKKQYAKLIKSSKKETLVERFEGFFYK